EPAHRDERRREREQIDDVGHVAEGHLNQKNAGEHQRQVRDENHPALPRARRPPAPSVALGGEPVPPITRRRHGRHPPFRHPPSGRNFSRYPRSSASRTCSIVSRATVLARAVPSARASRTSPMLAAKRARRSRIGSRKALRAAASRCFTSTSPTAPRRYRSFSSATSSRSGLNASWYMKTGFPSTWPGSVARSRVGSVYIERTFSFTTAGVSFR